MKQGKFELLRRHKKDKKPPNLASRLLLIIRFCLILFVVSIAIIYLSQIRMMNNNSKQSILVENVGNPEPAIIDSVLKIKVNSQNSNLHSSAKLEIIKSEQSSDSKANDLESSLPKLEIKKSKTQIELNKSPKGGEDFHFVHIPKCGGTSMTIVLRQVACNLDPIRNKDCCKNPGFCDWHAFRRCSSIKGCINHFPNRKWIFKPLPSITVMREPFSRLLSAFFYRGHSPNLDFFDVRPEAKQIKAGLRPKVKFDEYLDMHEYQNIQTRMLGADSFPYRNITVDQNVFESAVEALNGFFFIGLQEVYDFSIKVFLHEINRPNESVTVVNERDQGGVNRLNTEKSNIRSNAILREKAYKVNSYDVQLYNLAVKKFCDTVRQYDHLWKELTESVGPKKHFSCT